jgi:hypothetical protein
MEAEVKAMRIDEITHQIAKLDMGKEIEENTSMIIKQRAIQVPGSLYKYDSLADTYLLVEDKANLLID